MERDQQSTNGTRLTLPWPAILEACTTLVGWAAVIVATNLVCFFVGYWLGYGRITSWDQTLRALAYVPLLWLGSPAMIAAYAMSALTWYVPLHHESLRLRAGLLAANALVWIAGIYSVASWSQQSKGLLFSF